MDKIIPTILAVISCSNLFADPVTFPGNENESLSPNGKYAVVWVEVVAEQPHVLKLRNSTGNLTYITNIERHASIEWSPVGNEFAISDAFASNESRVLLYSVLENGEISPIQFQLPKELAKIMKSSDHAYIEVTHWGNNGLSMVASGYGNPEGLSFEKSLLCNHTSKEVVACHEARDR